HGLTPIDRGVQIQRSEDDGTGRDAGRPEVQRGPIGGKRKGPVQRVYRLIHEDILLRCRPSGGPAEHRSRHQPASSRVVAVEQSADELSSREDSAYRLPCAVDDVRAFINSYSAERERDG